MGYAANEKPRYAGRSPVAKEIEELEEFELSEDERVLLEGIPELSEMGETRRRFLKQATAMGLALRR